MARRINLVATAPKAGTYLGESLLREMGLTPSHLHIGFDHTTFSDAEDGILIDETMPGDLLTGDRRSIGVDVNIALRLLPPASFAVSHLPPHVIDPRLWPDLRVLHIVRAPRDMLQAMFHYAMRILPPVPPHGEIAGSNASDEEKMRKYLDLVVPGHVRLWADLWNWTLCTNAITVHYDDLAAEKPGLADRIARHFGMDIGADAAADALSRALRSNTPTRSKRDKKAPVWSTDCEDIFRRFRMDAYETRVAAALAA